MVWLLHSHPGATVVEHLASARRIEMGERNRQLRVFDLVDEQVNQNRRGSIAQLDVRISDDHEVFRQVERKLIVCPTKLGVNHARAVEMSAVRELSPDDDPAFDRRDEQRPIKTRADDPEQRFASGRNIAQHADAARYLGLDLGIGQPEQKN